MNQHIINWNLERAAEELTWANTIDSVPDTLQPAAWLRKNGFRFIAEAEPQDDSETALYSQTAIDTLRAQLAEAQARVTELTEQVQKLGRELHRHKLDTARLDWLADRENNIGNVQLPTECVQAHPESLRAAIDAAMSMEGGAA